MPHAPIRARGGCPGQDLERLWPLLYYYTKSGIISPCKLGQKFCSRRNQKLRTLKSRKNKRSDSTCDSVAYDLVKIRLLESQQRTCIVIGLSFRFCFQLRQSGFHQIISDRVISGVGRKWKRSDWLPTPIPSRLWLFLRLRFLICNESSALVRRRLRLGLRLRR